jgi:hypothetical protein
MSTGSASEPKQNNREALDFVKDAKKFGLSGLRI